MERHDSQEKQEWERKARSKRNDREIEVDGVTTFRSFCLLLVFSLFVASRKSLPLLLLRVSLSLCLCVSTTTRFGRTGVRFALKFEGSPLYFHTQVLLFPHVLWHLCCLCCCPLFLLLTETRKRRRTGWRRKGKIFLVSSSDFSHSRSSSSSSSPSSSSSSVAGDIIDRRKVSLILSLSRMPYESEVASNMMMKWMAWDALDASCIDLCCHRTNLSLPVHESSQRERRQKQRDQGTLTDFIDFIHFLSLLQLLREQNVSRCSFPVPFSWLWTKLCYILFQHFFCCWKNAVCLSPVSKPYGLWEDFAITLGTKCQG